MVRQIWGALRENYFQNALQLGGLYIDVANDSVVTKPKVEILLMDESGLEPIHDAAHFTAIAGVYLEAVSYTNHVVPVTGSCTIRINQ